MHLPEPNRIDYPVHLKHAHGLLGRFTALRTDHTEPRRVKMEIIDAIVTVTVTTAIVAGIVSLVKGDRRTAAITAAIRSDNAAERDERDAGDVK